MGKKVLLMILDGWGLGRQDKSNAIYTQGQPNIDALRAKYPHSQLMACGEDVGLPDGQMGNSEVGHLNIGAGRVVYQDLVKINKVCREHKMLENKEIKAVMDYAKEGHDLHFLGLVSRGGVHSSLEHLFGFLDTAKECGLERVFVHCFMDGRDTDPRSGKGFVKELEDHMKESCGKVASVCGRFYAMDRDKRWNRIKEAYDLLTEGKGAEFTSAQEGIQASYDQDVTDEFIKPICIVKNKKPVATIKKDDAVIFFIHAHLWRLAELVIDDIGKIAPAWDIAQRINVFQDISCRIDPENVPAMILKICLLSLRGWIAKPHFS